MQTILFTDIADTPGYGKYAGTYKLSTEIRKAGYTCQVIDNFSWLGLERLKQIVDKFVTDETLLVGVSCTLNEKRINGKVLHWGIPDNEFEELVNYIKSKHTKLKIVVGGSRITAKSSWPYVDYAVVNKADVAIVKILGHLQNGSSLQSMPTGHTKIVDGNNYFYTQEEFNSSSIDYVKEDIILPGESLPLEIARGCIFSCAYCHFDLIGKKIGDWTKHPQIIKDELTKNYELFGTTHYMFSDELVNESISKMEMLHNVVTSLPFKVRYTSYARVDLIHRYPEMRELLLESGAVSLAFGIETFNKRAGLAVGKGMHPEKIKETLHFCNEKWKGKIITSSNFIVGLPGESEESIWETVEYLLSDENPLDVFGFLPLYIRPAEDGRQGSKMEKDPGRFGYILEEGKPWQSDSMDFTTAMGIVRKIYSDPRVHEKAKFSAATWIGRILSLGYSVEEVFSMLQSKGNYSAEIRSKTHLMKQKYFDALMAL
jgi:radical SAM superfamily enzyme YgiQ (UPF0313 family)